MRLTRHCLRPTLTSLFCATLLLVASAELGRADPPGRVGRLSYINGTVSFLPTGENQWVPATVNYPVTSGSSFYADANGVAEIQVGATILRLDHATAVNIARLDDAATQIQLDQGAINLHVFNLPPGGIAVLTPMGEIDVMEPGVYDFNAGQPIGNQPPNQIQVTVLEGRAYIVQTASDLSTGYAAVIAGNPPVATVMPASASAFDDWAAARDQYEQAARPPAYVSPQMTGYESLNLYGRWYADPTYGDIWYPSAIPTGWAPYRYGHWAYVPPWGWTWIDDAPWGFAPFHYGRWVHARGAWGWVPGRIVAAPIYAPALVTFIGGSGFAFSIGVGGPIAAVGWVPLGPNEVFRPYYDAGYRYVRAINVNHVNRTVINKITVSNYRQPAGATVARFHDRAAATVIPTTSFAHAAPVHQSALRVTERELSQVRVRPSLAQIAPTPFARAGIPNRRAATAITPRPNQPARLSRERATASPALPSSLANQPLPKAPGPAFRPKEGRRPAFRPTPSAAPSVTPRPAPTSPERRPTSPGPKQSAPSTPRPSRIAPGVPPPGHVFPSPPSRGPSSKRNAVPQSREPRFSPQSAGERPPVSRTPSRPEIVRPPSVIPAPRRITPPVRAPSPPRIQTSPRPPAQVGVPSGAARPSVTEPERFTPPQIAPSRVRPPQQQLPSRHPTERPRAPAAPARPEIRRPPARATQEAPAARGRASSREAKPQQKLPANKRREEHQND